MSDTKKIIYHAKNLNDAFYYLNSIANIKICAGATDEIWRNLKTKNLNMPESTLSIKDIPELKIIQRHERYIEFGSCVTLSEIEKQGKTKLPPTMYEAISTIANPFIKNIATIGGNICNTKMHMTLYATLLALNAKLEFKNANETKNINFEKFKDIPEGMLLTKIRIPYDNWNTSIFQRTGPTNKITKDSASFVFLADTENGTLNSVSFAFTGFIKIKSNILENNIIGSRLPLSTKNITTMLEDAEAYFETIAMKNKIEYNPMLKMQFLNLLRTTLIKLT
jgi:CO/xanthine dehydrogenase FAD-binding subunit